MKHSLLKCNMDISIANLTVFSWTKRLTWGAHASHESNVLMHYAYYIPTLQLTSFGKSLLILLLIWWRNIASRAESSTQNIWHKIWNHGYIHYIHRFASKTWHSIFLMVVLALARTVIGSHNDGMIFFLAITWYINVCICIYVESLDVAAIVDISVLL